MKKLIPSKDLQQAIIGLSQLKSLDRNNKIRRRNLEYFLNNLDSSIYGYSFRTVKLVAIISSTHVPSV